MMDLFSVHHEGGQLLYGRVSGNCDVQVCGRLLMALEHQVLPPGSQVILDFSAARHIENRAVPLLIRLGRRMAQRGCRLRITEMSQYMQRIVEFAGALEGREFIEEHVWVESLSVGPVGEAPGQGGGAGVPLPASRELSRPSLN